MSDIVIKAENLGKKYTIGHQATSGRYLALRDVLVQNARNFWHKTRDLVRGKAIIQGDTLEEVWALRDVSFEIERGEVVGIIGRNGAGKSTLLKILSRITELSAGRVTIKGRVASLLEVGTGFHPELTGRENIYLNGAILGMTRTEIKRKFDEIVAFAEVEKYLDTPVKRYSSGMYVRLAFAVAAHLEPEILLVDEVLAVGDAEFQKKCLGKMGEVANKGRTVLFVSHNMQAISSLCSSTILIRNGMIVSHAVTETVVEQYLSSESSELAEASWTFEDAPGTSSVKLRAVRVLNEKNEVSFDVWMNKPISLKTDLWVLRPSRFDVSFHLHNQQGVLLFATGNFNDLKWTSIEHKPGLYEFLCVIPTHLLNEGRHYFGIYVKDNVQQLHVKLPIAASFNVLDPGDTRGGWSGSWQGAVRPILHWTATHTGDLP